MSFQPFLLGSEIGVYGMARAFHSTYHIKSIIIGRMQLAATKFSDIVTPYFAEHLTEPETFCSTLINIGKTWVQQHPDTPALLIPCGDDYSALLSRFQQELSPFFRFNIVEEQLHQRLSHKASFYRYCDQFKLPYPRTCVISKAAAASCQTHVMPFSFPVALKPSDSVEYLSVDFEGRKKAYAIPNQQELDDTIRKIYAAGYTGELICQDFIPGGDENMRVLNAYVDQYHHVRAMSLGNVLLGDPTPYAIGNYAAIIPDYNEGLCQKIKTFLEGIHYVGVANFDMKYDPRDHEYKLFEINLRQGRTNFFASLNGCNLAQCYVDDLIRNTPFTETVFAKGDSMLLEVPPSIFRKYAKSGSAKDRALELLDAGKWQWTLDYQADHSWKRRLLLWRLQLLTAKNYNHYMPLERAEQQ